MKRFLFFGLMVFVGCTNGLWGQTAGTYRHITKFSPLALIDFKSSIEFSHEFRYLPWMSSQVEAGFINPWLVEWENDNFRNQYGIRLRAEQRFFFGGDNPAQRTAYLGPSVFFIHHTFDRVRQFGFDCVEGTDDCAYYRVVHYDGFRRDIGAHLKLGVMLPLDSKDRFWMDMYWGFGFRHRLVRTTKPEDGHNFFREIQFASDGKSQYLPSASAGFKVGYRIR